MVLKKDLVAAARAHNSKACITNVSTKSKNALAAGLSKRGVTLPTSTPTVRKKRVAKPKAAPAPVKNLGFTAMFKKAASAPARPTLKAYRPRPYERGLAPRPTGPPATPLKKTRRGKRGGAKTKK